MRIFNLMSGTQTLTLDDAGSVKTAAAAFGTWTTPLWLLAGLGLVWCALFWLWFRNRPEDHPAVNPAELSLIKEEGASPALDFAFRLEIQGREGNLNDATALLAQLDDAVTRLTHALDETIAVRQ